MITVFSDRDTENLVMRPIMYCFEFAICYNNYVRFGVDLTVRLTKKFLLTVMEERGSTMSTEFEEKRIDYLNNWPNVEPFNIEKKYYSLVKMLKEEKKTIFVPFPLKRNGNVSYNKTISFMIEAVEQLERYPNFSYEFIFKAYDCFMDLFYPTIKQITDKNKRLCDNEWKNILNSHDRLRNAFNKLIAVIPVKSCQYLYIRLTERTGDNKAYARVTTDVSGSPSSDATRRKEMVDAIENQYGIDYSNYSETIRKASMLYRYILKNDSFSINSKSYNVVLEDKIHILVSGFLYTLRNDIMHGTSISITKSSKTTLGTLAMNYFAYLLLYYFLIMLIVYKFSSDYDMDVYDKLAGNMEQNIELYELLFGKEIEK